MPGLCYSARNINRPPSAGARKKGTRQTMKRFLCLLLLTLTSLTAIPVQAAGPKIVLDKADHDFGQVFEGQKVDHVFRFQNAGDAPLIIDRVRSSCGCTAALLSATSLAPGEVGEVRTSFDSNRFSGEVVKTIYLYSNDATQATAQFNLRGTVVREIEISPGQLDLGPLPAKTLREARLLLTNRGTKEVQVLGVKSTLAEVTASFPVSRIAPGKSVEVVTKIVPKTGRGRLSGYLLVQTNSPHMPELRIPVYGDVVDAAK